MQPAGHRVLTTNRETAEDEKLRRALTARRSKAATMGEWCALTGPNREIKALAEAMTVGDQAWLESAKRRMIAGPTMNATSSAVTAASSPRVPAIVGPR